MLDFLYQCGGGAIINTILFAAGILIAAIALARKKAQLKYILLVLFAVSIFVIAVDQKMAESNATETVSAAPMGVQQKLLAQALLERSHCYTITFYFLSFPLLLLAIIVLFRFAKRN